METVVDVRKEIANAFKYAGMSSYYTRTTYIARDKEQDMKVEKFITQLSDIGFSRRSIPEQTIYVGDREYLILFAKGEYEILYCAKTYSGWSAIYGINYQGLRL